MTRSAPEGIVTGVHRSKTHAFSKSAQVHIRLVAGLGVEGDAHSGATVKHRSAGTRLHLGTEAVASFAATSSFVSSGHPARIARSASIEPLEPR